MKIFHKPFFIAFVYGILVKPGCITGMSELSSLDFVFNTLRVAVLLLVLLAFFSRKHKVNRTFGILFLIMANIAWEVVATYIAKAEVAEIGALFNAMGISLFTYMAVSLDYDAFLRGASIILGIYVIINCMTVIIFPAGMYTTALYAENYFLSYRTSWTTVYLLTLTVCLLRCQYFKDKFSIIWCWIIVASAYLSMILVWTATGLFCFTIAAIAYAVWAIKKDSKPISISMLLIIEGIAFYVLVVDRMLKQFEFIIVNLLSKDLTLTSRTRIWDRALTLIEKNLFVGVGRLEPEQMESLLGYGASHPHNRYLHLTLCFGLIGLILFILLIYLANRKSVTSEKLGQKKVIMAAFVVYLTASQVEAMATTGAYIYPLYLIAASLYSKK